MKERPILMSAPMVRAILDGRKTQTRRVVKPQPEGAFTVGAYNPTKVDRRGEEYPGEAVFGMASLYGEWGIVCPYGATGDRLFVRETCRITSQDADGAPLVEPPVWYEADGECPDTGLYTHKRPSIHMPRWASRLTLEVVSVRVERVRDISEADAIAEGAEKNVIEGEEATWTPEDGYRTRCVHYPNGCECFPHLTARAWFLDVFFNINKRAEPDANPWVWVVVFKTLPTAKGGEA